jgi:hypothetical protein
VRAFAFQLPGADVGVRKMLSLVWSREAQVKATFDVLSSVLFECIPTSAYFKLFCSVLVLLVLFFLGPG